MRSLTRGRLLHALCLGVLLVMAAVAHAQSPTVLQGVVTDRMTGVGLAGIAVNLFGCGETVTDASGRYSLTAEELCDAAAGTLYASAPGFYVAAVAYVLTAPATTLDVTLLAGGAVLQGTVTEAGAGIAGGLVLVCTEASPYECAEGMTDAAGRYTVDSSRFYESAASGFTVSELYAFVAGDVNYRSDSPFDVRPPFAVTHDIAMASDDAIVLQGTVTDRTTGGALAGIAVNLFGCGETITDGNGRYSLNAQQLCDATHGSLHVAGAGYYIALAAYAIAASPTTLDLTLLAGGIVVQGTVTDASTQAGIADALVLICTEASPYECAEGMTDADGHYAVDSSRFYESAASGFTVADFHVFAAGDSNHQTWSPFDVGPPLPVTHDVAMASDDTIVLQGTITDRSTGVALAGIGVNLFGCGETITDGSGRYSLNAQQLCDDTSGRLYASGPGYHVALAAYAITGWPSTLDMTLLAGGPVLHGTVTDPSTQVGIAGAVVRVCTDASPYGCAEGTTDAVGQYTIDSSGFYESATSGFSVSQVHVWRGADFKGQSPSGGQAPLRAAPWGVQTIDFVWPGDVESDAVVTLTATPASGLPVSFSAVESCSVAVGGLVTCAVTAPGRGRDLVASDGGRTLSILTASTTTSPAPSAHGASGGQAVPPGGEVPSPGAPAPGARPIATAPAMATISALTAGTRRPAAGSGGQVKATTPAWRILVSAVADPPGMASPGSAFSVTDTVLSEGDVPTAAADTTTRYYLSLDTIRDATDDLLGGGRTVSVLSPGVPSTGTVTVTIPGHVAVATYYLLACIDDSTNGESGEMNDCLASTTTIRVSDEAVVVSP
jgi:hypothetical protein